MSKPENPPLFRWLDYYDPEFAETKQRLGTQVTLRDLFAASADVPWNAVIETLLKNGATENLLTVADVVKKRAEMKWCEADAMLAAR